MSENAPESAPAESAESVTEEAATEVSESDRLRAEIEKYKGLARKHEARAKESHEWRKANEEKITQFDALSDASKSDLERERDQARAEAESLRKAADEAKRTFGTQLVETQLKAAAPGKGMAADALKTLAGDLSRFLGDGGVDSEAVDAFLDALPNAKATTNGPPDLGAGKRQVAKPDALESGEALYATRHKRKSPAV